MGINESPLECVEVRGRAAAEEEGAKLTNAGRPDVFEGCG
jgi:hypothetical protein